MVDPQLKITIRGSASRSSTGFTLVEIVFTVLLVAILAIFVTIQYQDFQTNARRSVTQDEMAQLKRGIVGDSRMVASGQYTFPGYEIDLAGLPVTLANLVLNPATGTTAQTYNPMTRSGWRGPYVDNSTSSDYSTDGWGRAYVYDSAGRKIRSLGPDGVDQNGAGDDIEITF